MIPLYCSLTFVPFKMKWLLRRATFYKFIILLFCFEAPVGGATHDLTLAVHSENISVHV